MAGLVEGGWADGRTILDVIVLGTGQRERHFDFNAQMQFAPSSITLEEDPDCTNTGMPLSHCLFFPTGSV